MEEQQLKTIEKVSAHLERANFGSYVELLGKPWKFFWLNFLAGLFRGLGTAIGLTLVFAVAVYVLIGVLKNMVSIPIIGSYITQLVDFVNRSMTIK